MSKIGKRFERLLQNPNDIKWDELLPILRSFTYTMMNQMEEVTG